MRRQKKRRSRPKQISGELNIMPFIDIFSILNTFLLVSAAFINLGLIEVQLPFLTNAPPPKDKPERSLDIHVAVERDKVFLETRWTAAPIDEKKIEYKMIDAELSKLHADLVELRTKNPDSDKVNVRAEDDVKYQTLVKVLDRIMVRKQNDPVFQEADKSGAKHDSDFVYRKVVMAGVILR